MGIPFPRISAHDTLELALVMMYSINNQIWHNKGEDFAFAARLRNRRQGVYAVLIDMGYYDLCSDEPDCQEYVDYIAQL